MSAIEARMGEVLSTLEIVIVVMTLGPPPPPSLPRIDGASMSQTVNVALKTNVIG